MGFFRVSVIIPMVLKMKRSMRTMSWLLAAALLGGGFPSRAEAKGYSSGGHSYSSHSSSSSGGNAAPTPASPARKADSTPPKSYNPGSGHTFSSGSDPSPAATGPSAVPRKAVPDAGRSQSFDTAAARAKKEQTSKSEFTQF